MQILWPQGPIEAVVFDAVGTLIDPDPPVAVAYAEAARRQGVALDATLVRKRFREAFAADECDERRGPMSTSEEVEFRRWRRIVSGVLPEVPNPDRAFEELWDHFGRASSWRWFEDVEPVLSELSRADLLVGVGSNFDRRLRTVLHGIEPLAVLAENAIVSSEVGYRKPHRAFYQAVADRLGRRPDRILFIGDDPANDLDGPRAIGMAALLLDRDAPQDPHSQRLASLTDLPSVLGLRSST